MIFWRNTLLYIFMLEGGTSKFLPKCWRSSTNVQGVTSHSQGIFLVTGVKNCNLAFSVLVSVTPKYPSAANSADENWPLKHFTAKIIRLNCNNLVQFDFPENFQSSKFWRGHWSTEARGKPTYKIQKISFKLSSPLDLVQREVQSSLPQFSAARN